MKMETFEKYEYYTFECDWETHKKRYTVKVIGFDETHLNVMDASGDELVLPRKAITSEAKKITEHKFNEVREKILAKKEARRPKDEDEHLESVYQA